MPQRRFDPIHPRHLLAAAILAFGVGLSGAPACAASDPPPSTAGPPSAPEAEALAARFEARGYDWDSVLAGDAEVPNLGVRRLPKDLVQVQDLELKKTLFFRSLLPIALSVNDDVVRDRERLLDIRWAVGKGIPLEPDDQTWLADLAERYGSDDLDELKRRVDAVPPSLLLAQAAEESGWGTSRFAREGNALFGQYTWSDDHRGILPKDNEEGDTLRRMRTFPSVRGAIRAYVHNLNSHPAYARFRALRAKGASGYDLAAALDRYSERRGDYCAAIRTIMRGNGLVALDDARLADGVQVAGVP